jgi:hypothetical protein
MSRTFEAHPPLEALLLEQALLWARQLQQTADEAPDGQVLARVEAAAVPAARELARPAVQLALQAQATALEKKGRPAAAAPTATSSPGTRDTPPATS